MKRIAIIIILLVICTGCVSGSKTEKQTIAKETVLKAGMTVCAQYGDEKICIFAEDEFKRVISWDGVSRAITLVPRKERWYGELGLISPAPPKNHWSNHKGITRALIKEAEINISNLDYFYKSVNSPFNLGKRVYRNDGLYVRWYISVKHDLSPGGVLDLTIAQILINGEKPDHLIGSRNDMITVEYQ